MSQFTTPAILEMLDNYRWRLVEPFSYYTAIPIKPCALWDFDEAVNWIVHGRGLEIEGLQKVNTDNPIGPTHLISIPIGYVTDLASVPRVLWSVFPPHGRYAKAAIVHDYLYSNAIGTKTWADQVFLEAMTVLNVPRWRRTVMYLAVRLFGRGKYQLEQKELNG